eukprot:COSAG02_NODE_15468_length_1168_cov_1.660430_1_plen_143_part_00
MAWVGVTGGTVAGASVTGLAVATTDTGGGGYGGTDNSMMALAVAQAPEQLRRVWIRLPPPARRLARAPANGGRRVSNRRSSELWSLQVQLSGEDGVRESISTVHVHVFNYKCRNVSMLRRGAQHAGDGGAVCKSCDTGHKAL